MLGFLQGFAYGLFASCLPWFLVGMIRPDLAVPREPPGRLEVVLRYWFAAPALASVLWLTSLWGGFGPSLAGWLAGLAAIAVEVPLERRLRRWWQRRAERQRQARAARAQAERSGAERETGTSVLDPANPPADADELVVALGRAKQRLLDVRRDDLASQVDRIYSRYRHGLAVLAGRFEASELTLERSTGLLAEVCRGALDNFHAMASRAGSVVGVDAAYVRGRLSREGARLTAEERRALERRLELLDETEAGLRTLSARNEAIITALDDATVAVARVETARPRASVAAERALQDLQRFAEGAERYRADDSLR